MGARQGGDVYTDAGPGAVKRPTLHTTATVMEIHHSVSTLHLIELLLRLKQLDHQQRQLEHRLNSCQHPHPHPPA